MTKFDWRQLREVSIAAYNAMNQIDISSLEGKTIIHIEGIPHDSNEVKIYCQDGSVYLMCPSEESEEVPHVACVSSSIDTICFKPIIAAFKSKLNNNYILECSEDSLEISWTDGDVMFLRVK